MASVFVSPFLPYFRITIIDQNSRRGVPLVEVKTVNNIRYHTDSSGNIAFYEPGFMNQHVFFFIKSHGYLFPKDSFGFHGTRIHVKPGGHVTLAIQRINIAERLYRITGSGVYRDSVLLDLPTPLKNPTLQALVLGSDSVVNALFQNKIYWFWGDTHRPSYPLGNFHVPGATSSGGGPRSGNWNRTEVLHGQYWLRQTHCKNGRRRPDLAQWFIFFQGPNGRRTSSGKLHESP